MSVVSKARYLRLYLISGMRNVVASVAMVLKLVSLSGFCRPSKNGKTAMRPTLSGSKGLWINSGDAQPEIRAAAPKSAGSKEAYLDLIIDVLVELFWLN